MKIAMIPEYYIFKGIASKPPMQNYHKHIYYHGIGYDSPNLTSLRVSLANPPYKMITNRSIIMKIAMIPEYDIFLVSLANPKYKMNTNRYIIMEIAMIQEYVF